MRVRFFLASLLSLPCLALVGCGNSSTTDAAKAQLSAEDIATAKADAARVADEERAYQKSEAPAGKSR